MIEPPSDTPGDTPGRSQRPKSGITVDAYVNEAAGPEMPEQLIDSPDAHDSGIDDAELVARLARGEHRCLRTLYDRHASTALAVALRLLRSRGEAEEVLQEVFLDVWRRAAQYDPERAAARSWILCMARTRSIDRLRKNAAAERSKRSIDQEPVQRVVDPIDGGLDERRDRERVRGALSTLSSEQREAIELAYFDGLTLREVAERTASPLGTVKSRVRLALSRMAGLLKERS